ncbi:MAG: hypothetical protein R3E10_11185 [Gemmatimonadota bacterium]
MLQAWLRHADRRVVVESAEELVIRQVPALLPEYAEVATPPGSADVRLRVDAVGGGFEVRSPTWERPCSLDDLPATLEYALACALVESDPHPARLHGAGVAGKDGGLLLVGASGVGKSTLALRLSAAGLPLLSDDQLFVGEDGRVSGLRRYLKVDRESAREFGLDLGKTPFWSADAAEVWIDPAGWGGWARQPTRVRRVVFLEPDPGGKAILEPLGPPAALERLLHARSGPSRAGALAALANLLEGAVPALLRAGSAAAAFLTLRAWLDSSAGDASGAAMG